MCARARVCVHMHVCASVFIDEELVQANVSTTAGL